MRCKEQARKRGSWKNGIKKWNNHKAKNETASKEQWNKFLNSTEKKKVSENEKKNIFQNATRMRSRLKNEFSNKWEKRWKEFLWTHHKIVFLWFCLKKVNFEESNKRKIFFQKLEKFRTKVENLFTQLCG